jgi:hypothetical protein
MPWVLGIVAFFGGLLLGRAAKAKGEQSLVPAQQQEPQGTCDLISLATWAQSKGLKGAIVPNPIALSQIGPPSERFDIVITQSDCTVHSWNGNEWVRDIDKTTDMQTAVGFL